uniref:Myosin light chain alkali n=1 Tax=Coptotermes formosanus TaxID=36987 RepID=R4V3P6_COPFO|nr:myosin light chain [Coptotermes formosanus]
MAGDLSARDIERATFAFSIYDFEGNGTVDAFYVGDILRGLNLNPTLAVIEKMGGTKKRNEKKLKVEDFLPIFGQVKKDKDVGSYEDFLECMKLYDKAEDGKMLLAELTHILLALGERLTDSEVQEIVKDCVEPEDEDGFTPYVPFLKKLVAGPDVGETPAEEQQEK